MATFTTSPSPVGEGQIFTLTWTDANKFQSAGVFYTLNYYNGTSSEIGSTNSTSNRSVLVFSNISAQFAPGSYTIVVTNGIDYTVVAESPLIITCFCKGTEVLCLDDEDNEMYVKIENLKIHTLVKTYDDLPKRIKSIYHMTYKNDKTYHQICKLSNYENQTKDLYLTGGHSILVDELTETEIRKTSNYWQELHKIKDKFLLLSCVNDNSFKMDNDDEYEIYHIVLENDDEYGQYGIYTNGILTESMSINCYMDTSKNKLHIF